MRREQGSALITVIMVVLVLTMVGLSITYFMQVEDKTSGNDMRMKQALYAAEAGLRAGERVMVTIPASNYLALSTASAGGVVTQAITPTVPVPPADGYQYDIHHLGTYLRSDGTTTGPIMANLPVPSTTLPARYSLFVRMSKGSISGTRMQLICAGWVEDGSGNPLAVKILQEEFGIDAAPGMSGGSQKGNSGNTGSYQIN